MTHSIFTDQFDIELEFTRQADEFIEEMKGEK